jgi:hypothetical protein
MKLTSSDSWQRVAHATLGSRSLLNLRKHAATSACSSQVAITPINFALRSQVDNSARGFVERVSMDLEIWFSPDPALYPSAASLAGLSTLVEPESGIELVAIDNYGHDS